MGGAGTRGMGEWEGERGEIHLGGRGEVGVGLGYHRPRGGENGVGRWGRVSGVNHEVGLG